MIKRLTNNWLAKITCLLLALGIWIYVTAGVAKVANFPGSINIEEKGVMASLVAVKNANQVELKILADSNTWKKLSSQSFIASVDLGNLGEGTHDLPVQVISLVPDVQIMEIMPAKILVSLETIENKTVSVEAKIDGNAADGYTYGTIKFDPERVDVSGPRSVIEQITAALASINLNGEEKSFSRQVTLKAYDQNAQEHNNISFNPKDVKLDLAIIKAGQTKTVGIKVKTEGNPASGYWISQISTDPDSVAINGSSNILSETNYLETDPINIDGIYQNKTIKTSLYLPNGISLVDNNSKNISLTLSVSATDTSKETSIGFDYINLASNLKVSKVDPNSLKAIISGSSEKLANFDAALAKVNLDLASYNQVGIYSLDITNNSFSLPEGVKAITYLPSSIRITLENK